MRFFLLPFLILVFTATAAQADLLYATRKMSNRDLIHLQTQSEFLRRNCSYCDQGKIARTQRQTQEILDRRHIDPARQRDMRRDERYHINDTINLPKTNKAIVDYNRLTNGKGR